MLSVTPRLVEDPSLRREDPPSLREGLLISANKSCFCRAFVPVHASKIDCLFFVFGRLIANMTAFFVFDFI